METTLHQSPWLLLKADAEAKAGRLQINGVIGELDWTAPTMREALARRQEQFRRDLEALAGLRVDELTVEVSSLGGSFRHALAMHDFLAQYPGTVTTRVVGMTGSAATLIAQAGKVREISANAMYLIHRASGDQYGNALAHRETALALEEMDARMAEIYAKRATSTVDAMRAVMDEDQGRGRWMSAARAVELGLADQVFEPMDGMASAVPRPDAFQALGLPEPPAPPSTGSGPTASTNSGPAAAASEQTPQPVASAHRAPESVPGTASKGSRPMLTPDQVKQLHGLFGAEAAVAAVAEDRDFATAMLTGAQSQAQALADARSQVQTLTGERDDLQGQLAQANAQVEAHRQGLTDPLAPHTPTPPAAGAEADADAKAKAEAQADTEKRQEIDGYLKQRLA